MRFRFFGGRSAEHAALVATQGARLVFIHQRPVGDSDDSHAAGEEFRPPPQRLQGQVTAVGAAGLKQRAGQSDAVRQQPVDAGGDVIHFQIAQVAVYRVLKVVAEGS